MIQLNHVKKIFHTDNGSVEALKNVSLTIKHGEIFGVIGYSGAGKSTLIRLINLLEKPTSGEIMVDGHQLTALSERELRNQRRQIGMIFQHFNLLWSRTVAENIAFPLELSGMKKEKRIKRVEELVEIVGLKGREHAYPSQLSGGQKQRVGIARALSSNPKVLLCDEATSALDPKTTDAILHLLREINRKFGITIVLITHEMQVVSKICDRVAVLDRGVIVEEGKVVDVFGNPQKPITREFVGRSGSSIERNARLHLLRTIHPLGRLVRFALNSRDDQQAVLEGLFQQRNLNTTIVESFCSPTTGSMTWTFILLIEGPEQAIHSAIHRLKTERSAVEVTAL
ncbi:MAG: ATP-binding cassette domain-containing protein [Sporolactobacillus sp.]|nr:ATP-binding cassette domain-containing protein [Sporolactobacillus sp.]